MMFFKAWDKQKKNSGSTMIETLVSFTVLFVVLAGLYGIVAFSSELYMRSVDISRLQQRFYREIYKTPAAISSGSLVTVTEHKAGYRPTGSDPTSKYAGINLTLDTEKTNENNYSTSTLGQSSISMSKMGLTSFVSNTSAGTGETTSITPKAVMFTYNGN